MFSQGLHERFEDSNPLAGRSPMAKMQRRRFDPKGGIDPWAEKCIDPTRKGLLSKKADLPPP